MIIVTGATGKLGAQIVEELLTKMPASHLGVSVRDPAKAEGLARRGVRVRHGDFDDVGSLVTAFEDATQILMVSSNARARGGDPIAQHRAAIGAACSAGARRIMYTSHMGVSATSAFPPMHDHAATEAMLREASIKWTALRNGFYASTVPTIIGDAAASGILTAPQDGKISWTAHRDLAAAAAQVLLQEDKFDGPTPPLTAGAALDMADIAAILAELHGKPVRRDMIGDDEQVVLMARRGVPEPAIAIMMGLYRAARAGEFAAVDPTLANLIGREPMTVRAMLSAGDES